MANVRFAAHIQTIRGSVGNAVFSVNRQGNFLRTRILPYDPRTVTQLSRRGVHAMLVDRWHNTLTDANRISWNDLAMTTVFRSPTCNAYHPSGFNLYLRCEDFVWSSGAGHAATAPAVAAGVPCPFVVAQGAAAGIPYVTADDDWHDGKTGMFKVWFSPELSTSIYKYRGPWRESGWRNTATLGALPLALIGQAQIADGKRQWLAFRAFYGNVNWTVNWMHYTYWDRVDP